MAEDAIEIEYQLTPDDHIQFLVEYGCPDIRRRKVWVILIKSCCLVIWGAIFLIFISSFLQNGDSEKAFYGVYNALWSKEALFGLLMLLPLSLIIILFDRLQDFSCRLGVKNRLLKFFEKDGFADALLSSRLVLSPKGVKVLSDVGVNEVFWPKIEKMNIVHSFLCFWVNGKPFVYVPSRFFKSECEMKRVLKKTQNWSLAVHGQVEGRA